MVTIASIKRQTACNEGTTSDYDFKGLSTDTKPTENVGCNSLFLELDTGDFYYFNGKTWNMVGG